MPVPVNWFMDWFNSPYYHLHYSDRDEQKAAAFINHFITQLNMSPGSSVLDVACGRGHFSKLFADKGIDVTGIDIAAESITYAIETEGDNLHFYQHDVRLPFRVNYYDYAFNFFTGFGYFKSEREDQNVIRTISNALKPQGTLVLDYLNVHYSEDHLVYLEETKRNDVTFCITRWLDETHFYKKIIVEDERNKAPLEFYEKTAKYSLGDFNDMFAFNNLQLQEVYGDYQFNAYDIKNSPRLLMVAKKK